MLYYCAEMQKNILSAHLALLGVAIIYGANYTIAKGVLDSDLISPLGLVLFRILAGATLFLVLHFIWIRERVKKQDLFRLAICALLGVVLNQSFFITGLKYTTPINASVLMVTTPIFVLVISILLREERFGFNKALGIALGAAGTLTLLFGKGDFEFSGTLKGDVMILINAFSYSLYLVMVKPLMRVYNPMTVVKWIFLFGLIPMIPLGWKGALGASWENFTPGIWVGFFYVLLFTTFLTYLLNASALKRVKPSTVGVYIYLQPVLATLVALSTGKDHLTPIKILAAVVILSGVYLVSINRSKKPV